MVQIGLRTGSPGSDARIMVARSVRQGTGRPEASKRRRTLAFVRYLSQVIPRLSAVRPITVAAGGILRHMDTLSLILDDMRLRGTFVYAELTAPWSLSLDAPGSASFHIVTGGQAWLLREGAEAQLLQRGDLVILPGGQPHRLQDKPAAAARSRDILGELQEVRGLEALREGGGGTATHMVSGIFRFDVNMAAPLVAALPPLLQVRSHDAMPPLWLAIGLQFLEQEVASARPAQQAVLNRLLDVMFIESVRDYVEALPDGSGNWLAALRDRSLSAVLAQIHGKPEYNWTVQEFASLACLSRSAFAERFTQVMGHPPLAYLTRHRMRLAARHLASSSHPVSRVAELVGYTSEAAFSQAFKREYGVPPSVWREQQSQPPLRAGAPAAEADAQA